MAFGKLKNCPLVETVCEFRFADSTPWDATVSGLVFSQIKDQFPKVDQPQVPAFEVQIDPTHGPTAIRKPEPSRIQFHRADNTALIQVDSRMLSANMLAPYSGWEGGFRPVIQQALKAFRAVRPDFELARIGLRYINRIPLRPNDLELDHYVTTMPKFQGMLERPIQALFQRFELIQDTPKGLLVHQTGIHREGSKTSVMLDLDFVGLQVAHLKADVDIGEWLEQAHACVITSFNASITTALYARLKEGI